MAQVQFPFDDLKELVDIRKEHAVETLSMLGFPTEIMEDGALNVEVTPNRPDALCVEGVARVLRCYMSGKPAEYEIGKPEIDAVVDKSIVDVRPAFGGAVVRNLRMTDARLRSLMQLQEKIHETLGRKRRKVSIGIHDLDKVKPPFRFFACGREEIKFVPLDRTEEMTPLEILKRHEKGMAYAHLVGSACPMITDSKGDVLSFPPIINGELTKLTESTRNVFIDTQGTSESGVRQAVSIVASVLAEQGGKIEMVNINGKPYEILQEQKWALPVKESERLLGVKLTHAQVAEFLSKMGHRVSGNTVHVPGYRTDVINEVDLIEDVAIGYGFNNFEPSLPGFSSIGGFFPESACHEIMVGLGFDEAVTWTLSNPSLSAKANGTQAHSLEIENPITEDFTQFRTSMLPNLLSVLADSRNERLPIRIYESGPVAAPHLEGRLAFLSMHAKASFSEIKGAVSAIASALGSSVEFAPDDAGAFIPGRCASIVLDGKKAGTMGEVSPEVLSNFGLEQPVCAAELKI